MVPDYYARFRLERKWLMTKSGACWQMIFRLLCVVSRQMGYLSPSSALLP